jgi:hypothetical protein
MNTQPVIPKTPLTRRSVWWSDALNFVLLAGLVASVYRLAGGTHADLHRPIVDQVTNPSRPALAALAVFVATTLIAVASDHVARVTERRYVAHWYRRQNYPASTPATVVTTPAPMQRRTVAPLIERLVRQCGPISWEDLRGKLAEGGPWGPPQAISALALGRLLKTWDGTAPAEWLAPRGRGDAYNHVDNVAARPEAKA